MEKHYYRVTASSLILLFMQMLTGSVQDYDYEINYRMIISERRRCMLEPSNSSVFVPVFKVIEIIISNKIKFYNQTRACVM